MCEKRDRAITGVSLSSAEASLYRREGWRRSFVLYRDPQFKKLIFSGLCKNICLKESKVWREIISNKIIVTLVTQGLPPSFPSRPVA